MRAEQAQRTRERILDAAEQQFAGHGYAAATIVSIARTAGVAPDTVYTTFKSKRGILGALVEERVRGGEEPVLQQAGLQVVRAETDQRRQLQLLAADLATRHQRFHTVYEIVIAAAAVEPEVAALLRLMLSERFKNLSKTVDWIAANGPLREGLSVADAAATLWTLTCPEVHSLLRTERRWSKAKYTTWLTDSLTRLLLP